jgi:hypothetical protein
MNKPIYSYSDWYDGKVYLETGAIIISKTEKAIKAQLGDFSEDTIKKIQSKQKEIFDTKCSAKLIEFKNVFRGRFKKSEAKELLLNREIEDNRKILFFNPISELRFKNRTFSFPTDDLVIMREYLNNQIIKGEKYYGFVHSPNFKFPYQRLTDNFVYVRVTFDYYNWLKEFWNRLKLKSDTKNSKENSKIQKPIKVESKSDRIKVKVIALICIYNNVHITRVNCDEIAAKYHYTEKTSGEGLFQDYQKFSTTNGRIKLAGESKVKCNNRIKLIEVASLHLKGKAKEHAIKDIQTLEKAIADYDWKSEK